MSNWNQQNQGGWGNQPPQNQGGFNQQPQQQENFQQQGGYQQQQQPQGENLYVGTGKLVNSQNGRFIKLSFKAEDLQQMLQHVNENGWMSVVLSPRQNPSANGATHYMKIDTWQPNQNQQQGGFQQQQNNGGQQQQFQQPRQQQFQQGQQNQGFQQQPQNQGGWGNQQQPDNGGFGAPQDMPAGAFDPDGQEDDIPF